MRRLQRRMAAGLMAWALAGCVSLGSVEPQRYYVLEDRNADGPSAPGPGAGMSPVLLVGPTLAAGFYDAQAIAYSPRPGLLARYQFHSWSERPGKRFGELLRSRLERTAGLGAVASSTSGVKGDLVLSTTLTELYHDAAQPPGTARVELSAELVDRSRRVLVARRSFQRTAPVETYDAPGAVRALNQAVTGVLDDVDAWLTDEVGKMRR